MRLGRGPVSGDDVAVGAALVLATVNGLAGLYGLFRWYHSAPSREFWVAVRVGQALAIVYALLAGLLYLDHDGAANALYYLYALLPIPVGFVAEQLRLVAADQVLASRDLDDAHDVGRLPTEDQHAIVLAILRR